MRNAQPSASFVGETVPDGTIESPGAVFTKVWHIQNTGTCPWNKSWKLVYFSGDLMGGATVYDFPQIALPGDTVDVPVVLTAPLTGGSYRGNWKIQSPWGLVFGDNSSGNPFWVDIVVGSGTPENAKTATVFGITNVTYTIERRCTNGKYVLAHLRQSHQQWTRRDSLQHRPERWKRPAEHQDVLHVGYNPDV